MSSGPIVVEAEAGKWSKGSTRRGNASLLKDPGVIDQSIDEHLSLGQLKGADGDVQARADLFQNPVDAPAQQPAGAWNQHAVQNRQDGDQQQHHKYPEGNRDLMIHGIHYPR